MVKEKAAGRGPAGLTPVQRAFVRAYMRTQNVVQAAREAGVKCAESNGYRLWKNPRVQAAVAEAKSDLQSQFAQESAEAVSMLVYLMENAQTDSVRLRAAHEILDRAAGRRAERYEGDGRGGREALLDYADPSAVTARVEELRRRLLRQGGASGSGDDGEGE